MLHTEKINLTILTHRKVKSNPFFHSFVYSHFGVLIAGTSTNWSKFRKSTDASASSKQKLEEGKKSVHSSLLLHPLQCIGA
jgi:hypothetical protein